MSRGHVVNLGIRSALALAAVMLAVFLYATAAQAQSPSDVQYDPPTDSGTSAVSNADFPSSGSGTGGTGDPGDPADPSDPSDPGDPGSSLSGVLPSTGGSQVFVLALGTIALCATGLLVLNRSRR